MPLKLWPSNFLEVKSFPQIKGAYSNLFFPPKRTFNLNKKFQPNNIDKEWAQ